MGISENTIENSISIYPNPTTNQITMEFELAETKNVSIDIKNVLGQTVKIISNSEFRKGNNKIEIELSDLINGVYFVQLESENKRSNKKFIKE